MVWIGVQRGDVVVGGLSIVRVEVETSRGGGWLYRGREWKCSWGWCSLLLRRLWPSQLMFQRFEGRAPWEFDE
jgi:hypothetical protein